jgi:hypothetical protein
METILTTLAPYTVALCFIGVACCAFVPFGMLAIICRKDKCASRLHAVTYENEESAND